MIIIIYQVHCLILSLLKSICFFTSIIVGSKSLGVLNKKKYFLNCEIIIILYPNHWLIRTFLWSLCCLSFYFNYCSGYGNGCFTRFFCIITKRLLSFLKFIVWFFTLDLYVVSFHIWTNVAGMLSNVLQELITFYDCKINIILHLLYCLILYLLRSVCCFFHLNYLSPYVFGYFTRNDFVVWLWNNFYLISNSLLDSLLT